MDQSTAYAIYLFGCAARGNPPDFPLSEVDWEQVHKICRDHHSTPLIFPSVKRLADRGYRGMSETLYEGWKSHTIQSVIKSASKQMAVIRIIERLDSAGIPNITLKGDSLSLRYPEPQYRLSVDADIIIPPEFEAKTLELMADMGAHVTARVKKYHHSRCTFPAAGLIEVHTALIDEFYSDTCFNRYNDRSFYELQTRRCELPGGGTFTALSGEDEFIFVTTHFIKHFISSGCSIRNITDVLVLMRCGRDALDWKKIKDYFDSLKMGMILSAVVEMGVTRFGFARDELPEMGACPEFLADSTLMDIVIRGMIKDAEGSANAFAFSHKRWSDNNSKGYGMYILKWRLPRLLERFFPSFEKLKLEYPYARKNRLLIPCAFIHNIGRNLTDFFTKRKISSLFDIGDEHALEDATEGRMKLFKDLGMV